MTGWMRFSRPVYLHGIGPTDWGAKIAESGNYADNEAPWLIDNCRVGFRLLTFEEGPVVSRLSYNNAMGDDVLRAADTGLPLEGQYLSPPDFTYR